VPPVNKHCLAGEGRKPQRLREGKPRKKTKRRRESISVEKLTLLGEKTPKSNPGPPGCVLDIERATQFRKNKLCFEISVKYGRFHV
jgi:hypothetical protein